MKCDLTYLAITRVAAHLQRNSTLHEPKSVSAQIFLNCKRFIYKQAENGLQSRSSENGKTAVWHYGLKLQ